MKKESMLYGAIGLLLGVVLTGFTAAYAVNNGQTGMMGMNSGANSQNMMDNDDMNMAEMAAMLEGKTGDDFDEEFISGMIVHHQGAIEMAKLANDNAKHAEVKSLASDILTTQSKEIDMMQAWQKKWGYETTSSTESRNMHGMGH